MPACVTSDLIEWGFRKARAALLSEQTTRGHWEGELSSSALATATAVMALAVVRRAAGGVHADESLIDAGLAWLATHQNADGGWGDTTNSRSNISATILAHATFHATHTVDHFAETVTAAKRHIDRAGGVAALLARYGTDRTFSVPILTHCALAGQVEWREVIPLPFELACLPARFWRAVRLPVVSYALPALIAVGLTRFHQLPPRNPISRCIRWLAAPGSLRILKRIQPASGGFLEATPLTAFVTMSLASIGQVEHPVTQRGLEFLRRSVRADGSWPIDTNLATWVTTLAVVALGDELPLDDRPAIRDWLLAQQHRHVHPSTHAAPGGWAWTDLPGGVPDADDTPGAILALLNLRADEDHVCATERAALTAAIRWLLNLQNRDGGWPTFCRGWGALPFDRSAPDLTAHAIRSIRAWLDDDAAEPANARLRRRAERAIEAGFQYLDRTQRADGAWVPLWFGNQFAEGELNPTYGTARVLAAFRDTDRLRTTAAQRGLDWLRRSQNDDGGWGGSRGTPSSVEETALAVQSLLSHEPGGSPAGRGLMWLLERLENDSWRESAPIGFYFAKLWYFDSLYPLIFTVAALQRARHVTAVNSDHSATVKGIDQPRQQPVSI